MNKMIVKEDLCVKFEETPELKESVYDRVLKFFLDHDAYYGEVIMQSDDPQIEAPVLLSDIADGLFKFDVEYLD